MSLFDAGRPIHLLTEREFQRDHFMPVVKLLKWRSYHTFDSRRSYPGFPDFVLIRDRIVHVELKTEDVKSKITDAQASWILDLLAADAEVYVVRPRNLEAITKILGMRRRPDPRENAAITELASALADEISRWERNASRRAVRHPTDQSEMIPSPRTRRGKRR